MMIYNTMSGRKEPFETIHKNRVNMFVCGPTVYDDSHIGHARTYIAFDIAARYLKYRGFSVFYLQNITDVDDKIINRAAELGISPTNLARRYERRYLEDMHTLGVENVNLYARATDHIHEIIDQIKRLVEKGFAYETETGVYFDESKLDDFGKLSHQTAQDLERHRIEPDTTKRNPGDFSLWKKRDDGVDVTWDSPWGRGRPGWHIEDTAITETYFGPQYDIHGGAMDLIFPHHEAEIAQMESASGKKPMVRYWMHTGFLNVSGEKMSKSLGNFMTIRDLLERHDPQTFRFFVLSTHYRTSIDFSEELLEQSKRSLERIRTLAQTIDEILRAKSTEIENGSSIENDSSIDNENTISDTGSNLKAVKDRLFNAMDDDFNTSLALSAIFDLVRDTNRGINEKTITIEELLGIKKVLMEFGEILGLSFFAPSEKEDLSNDLMELIAEIRQKLRDKKDWALADEIRNRLRDMGISLEDPKIKSS
ncbi:MAG: cysteine--tRNA ligase [Methanotrichaceae archaeon]